MIVGPPPVRPVKLAVRLQDRQIVDAGMAAAHQSVFVELPVFVAVGAEPVAVVVMPFVGEAHGDPVSVEGPQFFDQAVVEFLAPFAGEEFDDRRAAR